MDLRELNRQISSAIYRAERLDEGSWEAQDAYRTVSFLEEAIARATSPDQLEGQLAREGAVRAALRAGEGLRALSIATRYLEEERVPDAFRIALEVLRAEADDALPDGGVDVKPVHFHLAA